MRKALLDILVDPVLGTPLSVEIDRLGDDGEITDGKLYGPGGTYIISNGIPRFTQTEDADQKQTERSFGFKWQQKSTYESATVRSTHQKWLAQKYGFGTPDEMQGFFRGRECILDAGCGSGWSSSAWMEASWQGNEGAQWYGIDISAAIDVAKERLGSMPGTNFVQADILQLPFREQTFDAIFSEGVLHHTPSTELAIKTLARFLKGGGEFLFYVYRKKGPIREFTDDHVREIVSPLPPEEAWEMLRPLTELGKALAELQVEVQVPEDVPYLGIKAGRYDVQRLIYWHFAKMFWNPEFSFDENHHINFDWYHPRYAHRQTEGQVCRWCEEADLLITHFDVQESGFTVRALKK